jgi:phage recombination protein Bet
MPTTKRTATRREGKPDRVSGKIYDPNAPNPAGGKGAWIDSQLEVVDLVKAPDREINFEQTANQMIRYKTRDDQVASITRYMLGTIASSPLTLQDSARIIQTCVSKGLNPIVDLAIWKQGDKPAMIHIKDEAFMRRANNHPDYEGFDAGWIISAGEGKGQKYIEHGTDIEANFRIVGAWCKVFRKSRKLPTAEAMIVDYQRGIDKAGSVWSTKATTMISKVARHMAHRLAFPEELSGIYSETEMEHTIDVDNVDPGQAEKSSAEDLKDQLEEAFSTSGQLDILTDAENPGLDIAETVRTGVVTLDRDGNAVGAEPERLQSAVISPEPEPVSEPELPAQEVVHPW